MIGVGGWRGRTEQAGPYWFVRDGKLVSDPAPGAGRQPRPPHAVSGRRARRRPSDHPRSAAGVDAPGRRAVRAAARTRTQHDRAGDGVLGSGRTTAPAATSRMLMALTFGKGRVFHTTLGHDINALSSVDFVVTLQRGTEWAATGQVTQKVPAAFPDGRHRRLPRRPRGHGSALPRRPRWIDRPAAMMAPLPPAGFRATHARGRPQATVVQPRLSARSLNV